MNIGVNALNGLSSFLLRDALLNSVSVSVCQRPKRAFFISTRKGAKSEKYSVLCVNALNGLSSFLRKKEH